MEIGRNVYIYTYTRMCMYLYIKKDPFIDSSIFNALFRKKLRVCQGGTCSPGKKEKWIEFSAFWSVEILENINVHTKHLLKKLWFCYGVTGRHVESNLILGGGGEISRVRGSVVPQPQKPERGGNSMSATIMAPKKWLVEIRPPTFRSDMGAKGNER